MKISLLSDIGLKKIYNVTLPKQDLQAEIENQTNIFAASFTMKGFRKGSAPRDVVRKKLWNKILEKSIAGILQTCVKQIVEENKYQLASVPSFLVEGNDENTNTFKAQITLELLPVVPDINYANIKINGAVLDVTQADVDNEIESLIKIHTTIRPHEDVNHIIDETDVVNVDLTGTIDGKQFKGGDAKNQMIVLNDDLDLDFNSHIIGHKVGDIFDAEIRLSDKFRIEELRGKLAHFTIKINQSYCQDVPKLDDDFAKKIGAQNVELLKAKISKLIQDHYHHNLRMVFKYAIFSEIIAKNPFDVPESILKEETEKRFQKMLKKNNDPEETLRSEEDIYNLAKEDALKMLRIGYFIKHVSSKENISISEEDFITAVRRNAINHGITDMQYAMNMYNENPELRDIMMNMIEENSVLEKIFKKINVKEKKLNINEFELFLNNQAELQKKHNIFES